MKYLAIIEVSNEDYNTMIKRDAMLQTERAMYPEKYPKYALTTCFLRTELPKLTENIRAVTVFEAENPEQIANQMAFWDAQRPDVKSYKAWLMPLIEYREPYATEFHRQRERVEKMREESKTTR